MPNDIDTTQVPDFYIVDGYVYESGANPPIPISNALISISDSTCLSNDSGFFKIKNLPSKNQAEIQYTMQITHPLYNTIIETLKLNSDTTIIIHLKRAQFSMDGYLYESNTNPPVPVVRGLVRIFGEKNNDGISNATGYYSILNISKAILEDNNYRVSIENSLYNTFTTTICIVSDTTINFELIKKNDFFPLAIGNYWKFDYNRKIYHSNYNSWFTGEIEWEVMNAEIGTEISTFWIQEKLTGVNFFDEGSSGGWIDTTYYNGYVSEIFTLKQTDYFTQIYLECYRHHASLWKIFDITRYQSVSVGDTLIIGNNLPEEDFGSYYIRYINNVGPTYFHHFSTVYHVGEYEKASLTDYKLNPVH